MTVIFLLLKCLVVILLIFLLLLFLVLFIPFSYMFSGNINEDITLTGSIKWLFGLIKISINFKNDKIKFILSICKINLNLSNLINKHKSFVKQKSSNNNESPKKKKSFSFDNNLNSIFSTYKKFKNIITIVKPKFFNISGYFGFEDLCLTGQLTAILSTLIHSNNVNLTPVFDQEIIDIKANLNGNIKLYLICILFLKSYFKNKFQKFSIKVKLFNNKKCIN